MTDSTEDKRKESCGAATIKIVLVLLGLWVVGSFISGLGHNEPTARATPTINPFSVFKTVHNSCGACGTDEPVGGWETEDGRSLVLADNKTFVADFGDGSSMRGEWAKAGSSLCLLPNTGGQKCFDYTQRVDAMKLDNAIYIRR